MDFQVIDVDLLNKPEDLAILNPYNQVPVLVERDLILYESNIINEYLDERFPYPQLMPVEPAMKARVRLLLHRLKRKFSRMSMFWKKTRGSTRRSSANSHPGSVDSIGPFFEKNSS